MCNHGPLAKGAKFRPTGGSDSGAEPLLRDVQLEGLPLDLDIFSAKNKSRRIGTSRPDGASAFASG